MVHKLPFLGMIILVGGTAAGFDATPITRVSADFEPLGMFSCSHECRPCSIGHDIVESVNTNAVTIHLENCNPGSCSAHRCDIEMTRADESERVANLWSAVHEAGDGELRDVLREFGDIAFVNRERGSLQALCPGGSLVLNLPLNASQLAAIAD